MPVPIEGFPEQDALFFKTLIHPDAKRPWAEVFVVAIDLRRAKVHSVAGTAEPKGTAPGARELKRTGLIPAEDMPSLVAGWNGGFKEEHGHYGMKIGGVLLVRPRIDGCTVAMQRTGELRILPWKEAKDIEDTFEWWRQTPACLLAGGKLHPGLYDENTNWGAALGGSTVVRRSAIGMDKTGETLFVAVSNHTSPRAIGVAMQHIGAVDAAQLDINYSYPRFVLFPRNEAGERESVSLFEGFKVEKDDYVREPNLRDFFYLTAPSSL
ncbi:MAG: phosphodiester glycosidase family protein [Polyangiaceae bacterium]